MTDVQFEGSPLRSGFTLRFLDWQPWLPRAEETDIPEDARQRVHDAIDDRPNNVYIAVLANDLEAWRARDNVHHHTYGGTTAEDTARREFSATVTSRINGCRYCASVHARAYVAASHRRQVILALLEDGLVADLPPVERALADAAASLALRPGEFSGADLEPLQQLGLTPLQILDALNYAAFFANANRLMLSLGSPD